MSHSTSRDPLNPPPASFSRPAPPYLGQGAYAGNPTGSFPQIGPFPPMRLLSNGESLGDGFPNLQPACVYQPHPFLQRDVTEVDWIRFLEDIQLTGRISGTQRVVANVLPMAVSVGFVGGIFVTRAIEKRMKKKKSQPAGELVDTWNDHFFHPRRLHVILAQGPENISGDVDGPAPDWQGSQGGRSRRARSRSSSSSSSSSDDDKRGRRRHHSSRKSERKAEKRAGRAMKNEKFRLVVLSI
ncbi:hypothetical protein K439DRAFT_1345540 [Ramaria rubella]|nr:hypothetical protein K439DRAFT_1345540 [Ramaria rubella]